MGIKKHRHLPPVLFSKFGESLKQASVALLTSMPTTGKGSRGAITGSVEVEEKHKKDFQGIFYYVSLSDTA
jgi:hypothetical protein